MFVQNATSPTPTDGATGFICPAGHRCDGVTAEQPCPMGTYLPAAGSTHLDTCLACPIGAGNPQHGL